MNFKIAKEALKRRGQVVWRGWEIWETVANGKYTGRYRVAPVGHRDQYCDAASMAEAFKAAKERMMK